MLCCCPLPIAVETTVVYGLSAVASRSLGGNWNIPLQVEFPPVTGQRLCVCRWTLKLLLLIVSKQVPTHPQTALLKPTSVQSIGCRGNNPVVETCDPLTSICCPIVRPVMLSRLDRDLACRPAPGALSSGSAGRHMTLTTLPVCLLSREGPLSRGCLAFNRIVVATNI